MSRAAATRHPLPDALRALALVGVLAVNAAGYPWAPWGPLMGKALSAGDPLAWLAQGLQAALFQGKAYPLLAMLFGMGLALSLGKGRFEDLQRARARMKWLLILGILHGVFLYFGDILTLYAVCGHLVLRHVQQPWSRLRKTLRRAWLWAAGMLLMVLVLAVLIDALLSAPAGPEEPALSQVQGYLAFLEANASGYLTLNGMGLIFLIPLIRALMLTGAAAARLRWLTHRRWAAQRCVLAQRWLWPLLIVNGLYGVLSVWMSNATDQRMLWLDSAGPLVCIPLTVCLTAALAQRWADGHRRWAERLAPLGQRTLSLYVFHALWCLALFSGAGLAWTPSTLSTLGLSLALWLCAWQLALRSRGLWPLEAWMARRQ